jgi:hypothetical protein
MKKILFLLSFVIFCSACKQEDNSLACTAIVNECELHITQTRNERKPAIKLINECFDAAHKYNCDTQKFKNFVFGFMPTGLKNPNSK